MSSRGRIAPRIQGKHPGCVTTATAIKPRCYFLTAPVRWAGVVLPGVVGPGGHKVKVSPSAFWLSLLHPQQTPMEHPQTQESRCQGPSDEHLGATQSPAPHRCDRLYETSNRKPQINKWDGTSYQKMSHCRGILNRPLISEECGAVQACHTNDAQSRSLKVGGLPHQAGGAGCPVLSPEH